MPTHESRDTFTGTNVSGYIHTVTLSAGLSELLVIIRHGVAADNVEHTAVEWNGVLLTQVGGYVSAQVTSPTRRRMSVWHLTDPVAETADIAGNFSNTVAQYTITVIGISDSGPPDVSSFATLSSQASGTNMVLDITPDNAGSLVYVGVMANTLNTDPFTVAGQTDVKVEDSDDHSTSTNHEHAVGYGDVVSAGNPQSMGFTSSGASQWGAFAIELPPGSVEAFTSGSEVVQASVSADEPAEAFGTGAVEASGQAVGHATLQASGTGVVEASGQAVGEAPAAFDPPNLVATVDGSDVHLVWGEEFLVDELVTETV